MKYIVLRTPDGEAPVLFPCGFVHCQVAEKFAPMAVASAGFVTITGGAIACSGASASLGLGARPRHDTALVARALAEKSGEAR